MTLQLGRLWRTVRWLRAEQIVGRVRLRLSRPRVDRRPAPPRRAPAGPWVAPPQRPASLVGPTRWRFLGEERELDRHGWDDPAVPLLWRYNQHYFDDLNAVDAQARRDWHRSLLDRWCAENPAPRGTAWAPYPTSLRIVNWVKWFQCGAMPSPAWLDSLAVQARWLSRRLEWHLLGNHLFANAKALVFAGLFFDGAEAKAWLAAGVGILERELPEQFLSDGGHFERSPMYHALGLEDLLDLLDVARALAPAGSPVQRLVPDLRRRAAAALGWLMAMRHPDGSLARFNDSTEGIAPPVEALAAYAAALGIATPAPPREGLTQLEPSGYIRLAQGPAVAWLDVAPIGPDYLPGHAHADTLSLELAVHGRALVVNRGTSVYGTGSRRQLERGTAAHSTVQIGDHDSSEVWSGFRVGRRARVRSLEIRGTSVEAAHDGYAHLPGGPLHRRHWALNATEMVVDDRVAPPARERTIARFHLAPGLVLHPQGSRWQVQDAAGGLLATAVVEVGTAAVEAWEHALAFGQLVPAQTLAVTLDADGHARVRWTW